MSLRTTDESGAIRQHAVFKNSPNKINNPQQRQKFNSKLPKQSPNQIFSKKVIPENKINQKLIYIYIYILTFLILI
jgi:hypothetical protein